MNEKKSNNVLKVLIAILAICLVVLLIYTFNFYRTNKQNIASFQKEKALLQRELKGMQKNYNELLSENSSLRDDLEVEQQRISTLLDSIEKMEASYKSLAKFRVQTTMLKNEKKRLVQIIDSLSVENKQLKSEVDSTAFVLYEHRKYTDSIDHKNRELSEKIRKASILHVTGLTSKGTVFKGGKEAYVTKRAASANKVKTCFTLVANPLIEAGQKTLYVQIINPKNNLLGNALTVKYKAQVLRYSASKTITYENKEMDVCVYIDTQQSDMVSGRYVVNLFDGPTLIASSEFNLR